MVAGSNVAKAASLATEPAWPPLRQLATDVAAGRRTAVGLVNEALNRLERQRRFKAVIALTADRAKQRATKLDKEIAAGQQPGPLAGIPFIAKDNILVFGADTTAASNMLRGFEAPYQATVIERLEAAGAICVAKANLDAFAHGSSTENSDFFTTHNPNDMERVPGGSSGGSAAAVVLNVVPFALGTDTGGSIRLPAAFCGAVGLKPSYGLVSRSGVVAMASSTDVVGPLATRVVDAALVLDVMAGTDPLDSTTLPADPSGYNMDQQSNPSLTGLRVGIVKEYMGEGVDPQIRQAINKAADKFKRAGASLKAVSLPSLPLALACYYVICPAEISSNLSRYDGWRFGHAANPGQGLAAAYQTARGQGFGREAKRRIMIGTYVLSSGYYDAYYRRAQQVRAKLRQEYDAVFQCYDLLIGPTAPSFAFPIGSRANDPLQMYLADMMTVAASLTGLPAISLPAGSSGHLPIGLQITAPYRQDRRLLAAAAAWEAL